MKAESTIRKQIARLRHVAEDRQLTDAIRSSAYDDMHALRWVLEDTNWSPAGLIETLAFYNKAKGGEDE
jgi:uncharacterized protein (UPF0147 family)